MGLDLTALRDIVEKIKYQGVEAVGHWSAPHQLGLCVRNRRRLDDRYFPASVSLKAASVNS